MRFFAAIVLSIALISPTISPPTASSQDSTAEVTLADFEGSWRLVTRAPEERRDQSVEVVVQEMNALIRGIARRRLRAGVPIPRRISITSSPVRIRIGDYDLRFPLDGSRHNFTDPRDEDVVLSQSLRGGILRQVFRGDGGTMTFSSRIRGERLQLTVSVSSDRLPEDVRLRLTYARN